MTKSPVQLFMGHSLAQPVFAYGQTGTANILGNIR